MTTIGCSPQEPRQKERGRVPFSWSPESSSSPRRAYPRSMPPSRNAAHHARSKPTSTGRLHRHALRCTHQYLAFEAIGRGFEACRACFEKMARSLAGRDDLRPRVDDRPERGAGNHYRAVQSRLAASLDRVGRDRDPAFRRGRTLFSSLLASATPPLVYQRAHARGARAPRLEFARKLPDDVPSSRRRGAGKGPGEGVLDARGSRSLCDCRLQIARPNRDRLTRTYVNSRRVLPTRVDWNRRDFSRVDGFDSPPVHLRVATAIGGTGSLRARGTATQPALARRRNVSFAARPRRSSSGVRRERSAGNR